MCLLKTGLLTSGEGFSGRKLPEWYDQVSYEIDNSELSCET